MALTSAVSSSPFRVKTFAVLSSPLQTCTTSRPPNWQLSCNSSRRKVAAQFQIPDNANIQLNYVKEQFWKSLPDSVKDFPWKKAEELVLKRLLSLGQQVLKWSFIAWFISSFLSDILFTMSRNQELMMPFGLLAGCFLSNIFRETSEELFQRPKVEDKSLDFLSVAFVFVILKFISVLFAIQGRVFLVHVANGGLMQVLWLWKKFEENDVKSVDNA